MKKIGLSLSGATPKAIKWIYRALMIFSGIWTIVSATYTEIPQEVQIQILKAITLGNGIVYFICQSFGYVESDNYEEQK